MTEQHERQQRLERELHAAVQGWRLVPGGRGDPSVARSGADGRRHLDGRTGGHHALRHPAQADELSWVSPLRSTRRGTGDGKAGSPRPAMATPGAVSLVEGAWAYRYPAKVSRHLQVRQEKLPAEMQAGHCLEGAGAAVPAVSPVDRARQARQPGGGGDCPRDGGLCLGDRPSRPSGCRVTGSRREALRAENG